MSAGADGEADREAVISFLRDPLRRPRRRVRLAELERQTRRR